MEPPAKRSVRTHLVSDSEAGQRLDNFLLRELKGVPKSHVYRIVRDGQVRVNGGRSRPATRISGGDRIRIPPVRTSIRGKSPAGIGESSFLPPRLFEDQDIL
ncbi:MAG: S4 domain-containing protein, partial [Arenicellales bacterium]